MELVSAKTYRSEPLVNTTDDKIRVVIDMHLNEWNIMHKKYDMPSKITLKEYCENKKLIGK